MGSAKFIRHIYKVDRALKTYTLYQLQNVETGNLKLTPVIRIEQFRGYSQASGIEHYLRLRNTGNWTKCEQVTGLRPCQKDRVFFGNRKKDTKSLLLFQFSPDCKTLIIDVFPAFYPSHKGILQKIVETHPYHL